MIQLLNYCLYGPQYKLKGKFPSRDETYKITLFICFKGVIYKSKQALPDYAQMGSAKEKNRHSLSADFHELWCSVILNGHPTHYVSAHTWV